MPTYYCPRCRKSLSGTEQERHYIQERSSGAVLFTQIDLPGNNDPYIGRQMGKNQTKLIVHCKKCGSLTQERAYEHEIRAEQQREADDLNSCLLFFFIYPLVGITIFCAIYFGGGAFMNALNK